MLKEITQLRKDAQNEDNGRAKADRKLVAEQTGMGVGSNFEISEFKNQIIRTEAYADELRRQLQDQFSLTDELRTRQNRLENSLASADAQVRKVTDGIEELRSVNADLVKDKSSLQKDFEKAVRQIRFELGEAQETIAEREVLNEQLTSNLVDTTKSSMGFESRLSATEEDSKATIAKLNKTLKKLESLNEELNYKLGNKDNAITGLLNELAKRGKASESIGKTEDVFHELDDRMPERSHDRRSAERESVTRLLIGNIDGQELRFPLFRDRLTIGRTANNDIQINASYISRRHAVIVTDEDSTRIVDWGSKNGVFVNSSQVTEQILRNGDVVTIGTADFKYEERPKRQ